MEQTISAKEKEQLIESWELPAHGDRLFSADNLIDAYFNGKKQGAEEFRALVVEKFHSNLDKSARLTLECVSYIKESEFTPIFAKLKINSYKNYSVLIGVKENDYKSDNFLDVYERCGKLEIDNESELFSISFHFAYNGDGFNENAIINDGYAINFAKI